MTNFKNLQKLLIFDNNHKKYVIIVYKCIAKGVCHVYERIDIAVKGSLLHDIGKLVYRSDHNGGNHSKAGAEFIAVESILMNNKAEILDCIKYHHHAFLINAGLRDDSMAYIVYEADNIASGLDRRLIYEELDKGTFDEKTPLHSVFNQLNLHKSKKLGAYDLKPYFLNESVKIPVENLESLRANTSQGRYKEIVTLIKKYLSSQPGILDSSNSLLKLLELTTSGIPSSISTKEIPDISIYDHSKITCALASCMYIYADNQGIKDYRRTFFESKDFRQESAFLLVSGDVSGIQDFIYTIASKGALKSLRGRSLYLEIMVENAIDDILDQAGLTRANLIYSGGGHFYMLLPNTEMIKEIINKCKEEINKQLLEMFSINLYLEMSYEECTADQLGNGIDIKENKENYIGEIYSGVSKKISKNKLQRYKDGQLKDLFNPDSQYNKKAQYEKECIICGESDHLVAFQKATDLFACNNCDSLASLGIKIARIHGLEEKNFIVIKEDEREGVRVPSIGSRKFLDIHTMSRVEENMKLAPDYYKRVYSINEPMIGINYSTNLWIGNYNKRSESNSAIDFEELASQSCGIKRLGVLRADVDDLGKAFVSGFEKHDQDEGKYDNITFSRTSTFSRELTMFFKYEINKLCNGKADSQFSFRLPGSRKNLKGKEKNIVIVYSGGDDVFAVGPWDEILEFSVNLRDAFNKFSLGSLSLSAGIGLFPKGYPISQMAIKTGELEDLAKSHNNDSKNSIAIFDYEDDSNVFTWSDFKDSVCLDKMEKLNRWFYFNPEEHELNKEKIYAGNQLLYRFYLLFKDDNNINIARLAYQLGRMKPHKNDKDKLLVYEDFKKTMYNWILDDEDRKAATMAINLVILLNRKEREE